MLKTESLTTKNIQKTDTTKNEKSFSIHNKSMIIGVCIGYVVLITVIIVLVVCQCCCSDKSKAGRQSTVLEKDLEATEKTKVRE